VVQYIKDNKFLLKYLYDNIKDDSKEFVFLRILDKTNDDKAALFLFQNATNFKTKKSALSSIKDDNILIKLALKEKNESIRKDIIYTLYYRETLKAED
jgi:hypothetical protein